ncbi:hypothetical protein D3C85_1597330 [compost metagenome]
MRNGLHGIHLRGFLEHLDVGQWRGQHAQWWLQGIELGNRNRDRDTRELVLDEDDRQLALGGIEAETHRFHIGQRIHVHV